MERSSDIAELLKLLSSLTDVGICFYDIQRFYQFSSIENKQYVGHYCELCKSVRLLEGGRAACDKSDKLQAVVYAEQSDGPFFFKCHLGLEELVVPIKDGNLLKGVIFLGQCRIEGRSSEEEVIKCAEKMGGVRERFSRLYLQLPLVSEDTLWALGSVISIFFKNKTELTKALPKNDRSYFFEESLSGRIKNFIDMNYMKEISPKDVAETFFVSPAHMARCFKRDMGSTVSEYLLRVRTENAKRMLTETTLPISVIARNVGIGDYNYFTRLFKKQLGVSPKKYRTGN